MTVWRHLGEIRRAVINIVMLMAGRGSRFSAAGVLVPKPLIEVTPGRTMAGYVVEWLTPREPHRFFFVCLRQQLEDFDFRPVFAATGETAVVIAADELTVGPAATALLAAGHIDNDDELLVSYCDGFIAQPIDDFLAHCRSRWAAGAVITYQSDGDTNSYAVIDADGRVSRTAEKQVISPYATAGAYYFRSGGDFVRAARRMVEAEAHLGVELFVCPVMNEIIADGGIVTAFPVGRDKNIEMGTPQDLLLAREQLGPQSPAQLRHG